MISRRSFSKNLLISSCLAPLGKLDMCMNSQSSEGLEVNIFSKHLQFLNYKQTGEIAHELGFSGVDLTVRPKGHVEPVRLQQDFIRALEEIRSAGSKCTVITTAIESADKDIDGELIKLAGQNGVKFYRSNWYKFEEALGMEESLLKYQKKIESLSALNRAHQIVGCYQNHAGKSVGAAFWEINKILKLADPQYFGTQYDIRHATVEGAKSWENGLLLLKDRIKTIVLKDFKWSKSQGKWKLENVPLGEGMVNFNKFFKLLKSYGLKPPAILHCEYDLGGVEHGARKITIREEDVYAAMKQDLEAIQKLWKVA